VSSSATTAVCIVWLRFALHASTLDAAAAFCSGVVVMMMERYWVQDGWEGTWLFQNRARRSVYVTSAGSNSTRTHSVWSPMLWYVGAAERPPQYPTEVAVTP